MVKLSVIIPVYNVEKYLQSCIESVLQQKLTCDWEMILVDDGSTDASGNICDHYQSDYPQIHTIHKQNGGLSSARNTGIKAAVGEYLVFLDSDDFWMIDSVQVFVNLSDKTGADVILGSAIRYFNQDEQFDLYPNNIDTQPLTATKSEIINEILKPTNMFQWHVWKSFYQTQFIIDHDLYFKEGILFEDVEWLPRVLIESECINVLNQIFVCYRMQRPGSITLDPSKTVNRLNDMILVLYQLHDYLNQTTMDENTKELLLINFASTYKYVFLRQALISQSHQFMLEELSYLTKYIRGRDVRILHKFMRVCGFKLTCRVVHFVGAIVWKFRK